MKNISSAIFRFRKRPVTEISLKAVPDGLRGSTRRASPGRSSTQGCRNNAALTPHPRTILDSFHPTLASGALVRAEIEVGRWPFLGRTFPLVDTSQVCEPIARQVIHYKLGAAPLQGVQTSVLGVLQYNL